MRWQAHRFEFACSRAADFDLDATTQSLYEGENVGLEYYPLDVTRLRFFGGSTGHWGGWCGPLDPIDFEERPWVPMSGWPLTPVELQPFYERAHRLCEVELTDYRPEWLEQELGVPKLPLDPAVFSTKLLKYSPPTYFGEHYRAALEAADNVTVLLHANVLEMEVNEAADRVTGLRCATTDGRQFAVKGQLYIVATGGIENPRLLLLSNSVKPQGLGNDHDLVGRYFMEHPTRSCGRLVLEDPTRDVTLYDSEEWRRKPDLRSSAYLAPSPELQRDAELLNGRLDLRPRYASSEGLVDRAEGLLERVGRVIRSRGIIGSNTYHHVFRQHEPLDHIELWSSWEQSPNADSRITLSDERDLFGQNRVRLDWRMRTADEQALERTLELLAGEVGRTGVGRLQIDIQIGDEIAGHHHMGTTRMHRDPRYGVVDADCRVHGMSNLYVAGSSIFPTSGAINPTLTIVALAERLADHVQAQLTG